MAPGTSRPPTRRQERDRAYRGVEYRRWGARGPSGSSTRRIMVLHSVMDRTNLAPQMKLRSPSRQMLTNGLPRQTGSDRLKRAPNRLRRIRLHVESIDVTRTATLMQEDNVLGGRFASELESPSLACDSRASNFCKLKAPKPKLPICMSERRWRSDCRKLAQPFIGGFPVTV